jgi:hypothetical protein
VGPEDFGTVAKKEYIKVNCLGRERKGRSWEKTLQNVSKEKRTVPNFFSKNNL